MGHWNRGRKISLFILKISNYLYCLKQCQLSRYSDSATGWTTEESEFDSQQGQEIYIFSTASRRVLGPTQPPIQLVLGDLSLGGINHDHPTLCISFVAPFIIVLTL